MFETRGGRFAVAAVAALCLLTSSARAQVAPSASFHPGAGTGAAGEPTLSPTGGYAATVPIDLPSPRGAMPIPLSVVYTGLARAGAAGAGWDVPVSYVAWQASERNRPAGEAETGEPPRRLLLALDGKPQRMVMRDLFTYVPYLADAYMELRWVGGRWRLKTMDNLEYRFAPANEVGPWHQPDLWLLTEVRDTVGGDKVLIEYDTAGVGDCAPDLRMKRLSYTFDGAGNPLYEIDLIHEPWWLSRHGWQTHCELGDGDSAAVVFDHSFDDQLETDRTTVLRRIVVNARNNLEPASAPRAIRTYHFSYDADRDTDKPRLSSVQVTGEDGTTSLPVATYEYGAVSRHDNGRDVVRLSEMAVVPRSPGAVAAFPDDLGNTRDWSEPLVGPHFARADFSSTEHMLRDLTGDGLIDEVWRTGGTWHLVEGRFTDQGFDLAGPVTTWSEPAELFMQSTFRFVEPTTEAMWAREPGIITEVWSQLVDWNGDGRLDVVDARGGGTSHWRIWINHAAPGGGIAWTAHQVRIDLVRAYLDARGLQSVHALVESRFTSAWWPDALPVARSKSWTRVRSSACRMAACPQGLAGPCQEPTSCPHIDDYALSIGSDTISEWSLTDVNEDGFPDFVTQTGPTQVCEGLSDAYPRPHDPDEHDVPLESDYLHIYVATHTEDLYRGEICGGGVESVAHGGTGTGAAAFLNRHGAFYGESASTSPFAGTPIAWEFYEHAVGGSDDRPLVDGPYADWDGDGVQYGLPSGSMGVENFSYQFNWLDDAGSDGSLRTFGNSFGRANAFKTDRRSQCPLAGRFTTTQVTGHVDVNGDGLLDLVESSDGRQHYHDHHAEWHVQFNTGRGYGAPRSIEMPVGEDFALSQVQDSCVASTHDPIAVSGVQDLDGDGLPEFLRVQGGELRRSSIATQGDRGGAGRLIAIGNGLGARTAIHYANAKQDAFTPHAVPFPEIVVSQVETEVLDGSGPGVAPVYYRYGNASMVYDPMAARWTFPGYRWQLTLAGTPPGKDQTMVSGVLVRYEHAEPTVTPWFVDKAVGSRLERITRTEGEFDPAALHQFLVPGSTTPFAVTSLTYGAIKGPLTAEPEAPLDCGGDYPGDFFVVTDLCRASGIAYRATTRTWEGSAPTVGQSVEAGQRITSVDSWGRPTATHAEGDTRRLDDDVCTSITYGDGTPFPSVITSVTLSDCGFATGAPITLASSRMLYDNLPFGQVDVGRVTARWVDRYEDGVYLGTFQEGAYTYDEHGHIATETSARTLGGASVRAVTHTRDAFGLSVVETTETASDIDHTFIRRAQTSTWPSRGDTATDPTGVVTAVELDALGRPIRTTVEAEGGKWTLQRLTYLDQGRRIVTESFPGNTPVGGEDAALDRTRGTAVFDALGRERFTQTELGASYAGATVVTGVAERDALGRVTFEAAPFDAGAAPFDPASVADSLYGVATLYDRRGRAVKSVEAFAGNEGAIATSVAAKVYVAETRYRYIGAQLVVETLGPDEHDPTSPRFGAYDQAYVTAVGRETRRIRRDAQDTILDLVDQSSDRLGNIVATIRYADPASMTGVSRWTSKFDSLGRRVRTEEPGTSPVETLHDEDGNELETVWMDGTTRRRLRASYDGFGRLTERVLDTTALGQAPVVESRDLYHYDLGSEDHNQPAGAAERFLGRLAWAETPGIGKVYFGYDALGRGASEVYAYDGHEPVTQTSTLTVGGVPVKLTLATPHTSDTIEYFHDSAWRTRQVRRDGERLFNAVDVSALGQYRVVELGNGVTEHFTFESAGRREPLAMRVATPQGAHVFENVQRDGAGRVSEERHESPTETARFYSTFDDLGRLATRLQSGGVMPGLELFTYDGLGNLSTRLSSTGSGNRAYTPSTIDPDRLCRYGAPGESGCNFKYDGAGNVVDDLTASNTRTFRYDAAQRIRQISRGAAAVTLSYGPVGRMKTTVDGPTARTVWSFGGLVETKVRSDGVVQIERTVGGPLGAFASLRTTLDANGAPLESETVYLHGDGRANRLVTRADGRVAQAATYAAFGATTSNTGTDPLTTTDDLWNGGDELPEVGVVLLGPRAYDPEMGRFLQRDPIAVVARSTTGNPYAFSFSDPVNLSDPTGLSPGMEVGDTTGRNGGGGGGVNWAAWILTNAGTSLLERMTGASSEPAAPHAAVATGASQLRLSIPQFTLRSCGWTCRLGDAASHPLRTWHRTQVGMRKGAMDFVSGVGQAVKSVPGCIGPRGCDVRMVINGLESQGKMLTDPEGTFCEGGCAEGTSRFFTREALAVMASQGVGAVVGRIGFLRLPGGFPRSSLAKPLPRGSIARIAPGSLPAAEEAALEQTLRHIDAGTRPTGALRVNWGARFRNRFEDLPGRSGIRSPYREYRVAPPPGVQAPGPLRVVVDTVTREMYYTWTHYGQAFPPFVRIR